MRARAGAGACRGGGGGARVEGDEADQQQQQRVDAIVDAPVLGDVRDVLARRLDEVGEDRQVHDHDEDDVHVEVVVECRAATAGRHDEQHAPQQHREAEDGVDGDGEPVGVELDLLRLELHLRAQRVEHRVADAEVGLQAHERLREVGGGLHVEADADVVVREDVLDAVGVRLAVDGVPREAVTVARGGGARRAALASRRG